MIDNRFWRPAAQRSVRNACGFLQGQQSAWSTASTNARSAATNLVNAYLSDNDIAAMDLGIISDMEGIRDKAKIKLRALQEQNLLQYLKSYDALVNAVLEMRTISTSMRTYVKDSGGGPLIEFTKNPTVDGDTGDGGGVAVFETLPLCIFEFLAKEMVVMFQKELRVKWLLAKEFHNLVYKSTETTANSNGQDRHFGYGDPVKYAEGSELGDDVDEVDEALPATVVLDRKRNPPSRETLQVYLTALLAEGHINKDRVSEISRLWSEEMTGAIAGSPIR
ncbi:unnamed protein product [Calypogeia fissa]